MSDRQGRTLGLPESAAVSGQSVDVLQLLARVGVGSGVPAERADAVDQRERELRQHLVEFRD
jgi:hypothetical protein